MGINSDKYIQSCKYMYIIFCMAHFYINILSIGHICHSSSLSTCLVLSSVLLRGQYIRYTNDYDSGICK